MIRLFRSAVMRLRELDGRPVISASTGDRLGRISQVVLDLANRRVAGFRLRAGGLLDRRWRVAAMQDVAAITDSGVMLPDAIALREDEQVEGQIVLGRRGPYVVDDHGDVVGRLADVEADPATGELLVLLVIPASGRQAPFDALVAVPVEQMQAGGRQQIVVRQL